MKKKIIMILIFIIIIVISNVIVKKYKSKELSEHKNENEEIIEEPRTDDMIPEEWRDNGIFTKYYNEAYQKLQTLTLEEKIGQILLVRYNKENAKENIENYNFGGYIFFEKDFKEKTKEQVQEMIKEVQEVSKIPLIIAVDEEGGSVVRISSNRNLTESKFKSPRELYNEGGLEKIKEDTIEKSKILYDLGINLNLAPVVDISTDKKDYIYKRTLGEGKEITSEYAKAVISASKGTGVTYSLKHFPGYGSNLDTHKEKSVDTRSYEEIMNNDVVPFKAGIDEGAETVLVSHNIVNSIDEENPASLSSKIHDILRKDLKFTGIIITDDLDMQAAKIEKAAGKAALAGNDLIIVGDYKKSISDIKEGIENGSIEEEIIDQMAFRVLSWKLSKFKN